MSLSALRLQLAHQIAQAVRNLANQANTIKNSMMPILGQIGVTDIKAKLRHDKDKVEIILEFDFTTDTLAENMYKQIKKYLGQD